MSSEDPLLDKLGALPGHTLNAQRAAKTLRMAEESLPQKVRPGIRWPEFAIASVLSVAGFMYTVGSVNKLGNIYGSNHETATNTVK